MLNINHIHKKLIIKIQQKYFNDSSGTKNNLYLHQVLHWIIKEIHLSQLLQDKFSFFLAARPEERKTAASHHEGKAFLRGKISGQAGGGRWDPSLCCSPRLQHRRGNPSLPSPNPGVPNLGGSQDCAMNC